MAGRTTFDLSWPILRGLSVALGCLPRGVRRLLWDACSWSESILFVGLRYALIRSMAGRVGRNVYIGKYVTIKCFERLSLGDNVSIHNGSYVDASGGVSIGSDVSIAHRCSIMSSTHTWNDGSRPIKYNAMSLNPVRIDDDVWIGCGVTILCGSVVCSRSIIGAASLVRGHISAGSIAVGVPAKRIRATRDDGS